MSEQFKIELSGNLILKIIHTPEDAQNFYSDSFENVSLLVEYAKNGHSNQGKFKDESIENYFNIIEHSTKKNSDVYEFIADDGYTFYSVYLYDDSIRIDEKLENKMQFIENELPQGIIKFRSGEFGANDESLVSWENSVCAILQGDIYGYQLLEIEACNLGHDHESEIESCWGFYGYKDASDLITNIILDSIDTDKITLYDDLKKILNKEDLSKIKLKNLIE